MPSHDTTVIVGIDCATEPARIGLARAELRNGSCTLTDAQHGVEEEPVHEIVRRWLRRTRRGLIALDAPLGWPSLLADMLPEHRAGERLVGVPDRLFHRLTDDYVAKTTGKRPLEVAADRIGRTAHRSLELLDRIRSRTRSAIPLAWSPDIGDGIHAIEVYPAATLAANGAPSSGYKRVGRMDLPGTAMLLRERIVESFAPRLDVGDRKPALMANPDVLDAAVCVLAALDFLAGDSMPPVVGDHLARKEGWIWVRQPKGAAQLPSRTERSGSDSTA